MWCIHNQDTRIVAILKMYRRRGDSQEKEPVWLAMRRVGGLGRLRGRLSCSEKNTQSIAALPGHNPRRRMLLSQAWMNVLVSNKPDEV
jgi:hypothetical protein